MSMTDKRLELNLKEPFFKEDWAFKIDFSKCKNTKGCVIDDETAVYM